MRRKHQQLPASGAERETLRAKGQFWTPPWVAESMVAYAVGNGAETVFDPAVGEGAFFHAVHAVSAKLGRELGVAGTEIDPAVLQAAVAKGLPACDVRNVVLTDFVLSFSASGKPQPAIVANPPYIRHHRLSAETKDALRKFCVRLTGKPVDGRAGYHIYFLLRALEILAPGGRLAFIMPADTCEGVFAPQLWRWITSRFRLDAVATFAPEASPFPGVDTNPVIFFIENAAPVAKFHWCRCLEPDSDVLEQWVRRGFRAGAASAINLQERTVAEGLETGLSRPQAALSSHAPPFTLGMATGVMRGIATGANDFFFLTHKKARELGIPPEFLIPAIGRTRDVTGNTITEETLADLDAAGRPTLLFSPDGRPLKDFPAAVRRYLEYGENSLELHKGALISMRRPWYKMEKRTPPPFLFAYLGRRNARFIRNLADVVPLTGFLCVYPHQNTAEAVEALWGILNEPGIGEGLARVGKSYGDGAVKVEPRSLERLPLRRLPPRLHRRPISQPEFDFSTVPSVAAGA